MSRLTRQNDPDAPSDFRAPRSDLDAPVAAELAGRAPLVLALKEAGVPNQGECLGPVGGRIVAEVLMGCWPGTRAPTSA